MIQALSLQGKNPLAASYRLFNFLRNLTTTKKCSFKPFDDLTVNFLLQNNIKLPPSAVSQQSKSKITENSAESKAGEETSESAIQDLTIQLYSIISEPRFKACMDKRVNAINSSLNIREVLLAIVDSLVDEEEFNAGNPTVLKHPALQTCSYTSFPHMNSGIALSPTQFRSEYSSWVRNVKNPGYDIQILIPCAVQLEKQTHFEIMTECIYNDHRKENRWTTFRRFSDLHSFHRSVLETLKTKDPDLLPFIPKFPKKKVKILFNHKKEKFIQQRRTNLEEYIQTLISVKEVIHHILENLQWLLDPDPPKAKSGKVSL